MFYHSNSTIKTVILLYLSQGERRVKKKKIKPSFKYSILYLLRSLLKWEAIRLSLFQFITLDQQLQDHSDNDHMCRSHCYSIQFSHSHRSWPLQCPNKLASVCLKSTTAPDSVFLFIFLHTSSFVILQLLYWFANYMYQCNSRDIIYSPFHRQHFSIKSSDNIGKTPPKKSQKMHHLILHLTSKMLLF